MPGIQIPVLTKLPYKKGGNNQYIPQYFHPDFQRLVDNGAGVCGQVGCEHCDACNLEYQRLTFPSSQLVQINYSNKKDSKKYGEKRNGQKRLVFLDSTKAKKSKKKSLK